MADIFNPFLTYFPNYSGGELASEFRFYNYTPNTATLNTTTGLDNLQVEELQTAKTNALIKGDTFTVKMLDSILKYGLPTLKALGEIGVIKNKNFVTLAELQANKDVLGNILARTSGNLDPNSLETVKTTESTRSAETNILGIPLTYIVVGLVGFALYMLFKESTPNKQKSK